MADTHIKILALIPDRVQSIVVNCLSREHLSLDSRSHYLNRNKRINDVRIATLYLGDLLSTDHSNLKLLGLIGWLLLAQSNVRLQNIATLVLLIEALVDKHVLISSLVVEGNDLGTPLPPWDRAVVA